MSELPSETRPDAPGVLAQVGPVVIVGDSTGLAERAGECLESTGAGTHINESPSYSHSELPRALARLGSAIVVGVGIAFTGLVGYLALAYRGDIVSLIKLVVMVVPAASIYVSSGSRGALLLHIVLFTLIALLSSLGGNPGLAFAAIGITAYAVLNKLHQLAWQ